MNPLIISATEDTPEVVFKMKEGNFQMSGRSLPEDVIEFYTPVYSWLEQYVSNPNDETIFKVKIDYFNSASQRAINEIFNILDRINLKGKKINIEWYYYQDDDEMKEAGEEYAEITNLNFQYISYVPD